MPGDGSRELDDAKMETIMGRLLQVGGAAGGGMRDGEEVASGIWRTMRESAPTIACSSLRRSRCVTRRRCCTRLRARRSRPAIIELGILLLVATPICRVIFAAIAFAVERDRLYVAVSVTVLAVLLYGLLRPM